MFRVFSRALLLLTLTSLCLLPQVAAEYIELDRCIAEKCRKNGLYAGVQISEDQFIVYIDANRCSGKGFYCPTSYGGFRAKDGTLFDSGDYVPGTPSEGTIKVYIPREYKGMYISEINGSDRDDYLSLVDFEDFRDARELVEATDEVVDTLTIEALIERLAQAYRDRDVDLLTAALSEDALLLGGEAGATQLLGVEQIASHFELQLSGVTELDLTLTVEERTVEGRLAYVAGRYDSAGAGGPAGRFLIVLSYTPELGWRIQSGAQLPLL